MEIDFSKAPEGFPIWIESLNEDYSSDWHQEEAHLFRDRSGKVWMKDAIEYCEIVVHRPPQAAPWSGDGLPPVGIECEFTGHTPCPEDPADKDLRPGANVKIIAHFKDGDMDLAAFTFNPKNPDRGTAIVEQGASGCFRPLRTPEQLAAEEREREIHGMASDLYSHAIGCRLPMSETGAEQLARHMHADGYRRATP